MLVKKVEQKIYNCVVMSVTTAILAFQNPNQLCVSTISASFTWSVLGYWKAKNKIVTGIASNARHHQLTNML